MKLSRNWLCHNNVSPNHRLVVFINLSTQLPPPSPSWAWLSQGTREQQTHTQPYHITHSQANLQLGWSDCLAKPTHSWVYQAAGTQANTLLGLTGYSAKRANICVSQTTHSQSNIHIKDQPSQLTDGFLRAHHQAILLLGFSGYSAKPANS